MTDERIERVREAFAWVEGNGLTLDHSGQPGTTLEALDSLERELTEAKASAAAWQADALLREQNRADLERELTELREVATESASVLDAMMHEDGWPPERLAPRLVRLVTILRTALSHDEVRARTS